MFILTKELRVGIGQRNLVRRDLAGAEQVRRVLLPAELRRVPTDALWRNRRQRASVGKISAKCCSFWAVSAPIFARKYAFCSIFQNLPDSQAEILEI